jgi:hypothetical protein
MTERSEMATKLLEKAGWFPGRRLNIDGLRVELEAKGIQISEPVSKFIEEFDKSYFFDEEMTGYYAETTYAEILDINVSKHFDIGDEQEFIEKANRLYNTKLIKIGQSRTALAQLFICEKGLIYTQYYGLNDDGIFDDPHRTWEEVLEEIIVYHWKLCQNQPPLESTGSSQGKNSLFRSTVQKLLVRLGFGERNN